MESTEDIDKFLVSLWFIWTERNSHLWNNQKREEWEIIDRTIQWLEEYNHHQLTPTTDGQKKITTWKPSMAGVYKINVDATVFEGNGYGFGVVIRYEFGNFCLAGVKCTRRQWLPEFAEVTVIDFGLEVAKSIIFHLD
ncbi:unnamed protein product [Linum trigynum]|uniref:RNase H type-1 domain-containing protein n=1 Tax=Linum trigynum TaxID=586398 RepID=A0AAV2GUB8_9ROSI